MPEGGLKGGRVGEQGNDNSIPAEDDGSLAILFFWPLPFPQLYSPGPTFFFFKMRSVYEKKGLSETLTPYTVLRGGWGRGKRKFLFHARKNDGVLWGAPVFSFSFEKVHRYKPPGGVRGRKSMERNTAHHVQDVNEGTFQLHPNCGFSL